MQMLAIWNQEGDRKQPNGHKGDTKQAKETLKACLGEQGRTNVETGSQKTPWPRPIIKRLEMACKNQSQKNMKTDAKTMQNKSPKTFCFNEFVEK